MKERRGNYPRKQKNFLHWPKDAEKINEMHMTCVELPAQEYRHGVNTTSYLFCFSQGI